MLFKSLNCSISSNTIADCGAGNLEHSLNFALVVALFVECQNSTVVIGASGYGIYSQANVDIGEACCIVLPRIETPDRFCVLSGVFMPEVGLEPTRPLRTIDFESIAAAITPLRRSSIIPLFICFC